MDRRRRLKYGIFAGIAAVILIVCVSALVIFIRKTNNKNIQSSASVAEEDASSEIPNSSEENKETEKNTDASVSSEASSEEIQSEENTSGTNTNENDTQDTSAPSDEASEPSGSGGGQSVPERASAILSGMSVEEKVGQMFIARCPQSDAAQKAADYHLGGYILFGRDFQGKTKEQVISDIQSYQDAASVSLFIGVDEEGGTVNRVSLNPNLRAAPFWSPQELYASGGFSLIRSDTLEKCRLLHSLGINVNFAPVCDVSQNPADFIYARSFGRDANQTAEYIRNVTQVMSSEGMGAVLKHFPGYGNNADTHTGIAYDNRPYETFLNSDFLPFKAGIDNGAGIVLVSHNVVTCMDGEYPASLSSRVHEILRSELGFSGVIVTDDLAMDGIRDFVSDDRAAVLAVQAGNDLLCCTDFETQIPTVINAVMNGEISEQRIDESVMRILMLKISLGII